MILLWPSVALAHIPVLWVVTPADDWCATINAVEGGDIVAFVEGDYYGPCDIVAIAPIIDGEVTIIESLDYDSHAVFHNGGGDYILSVTGPTVRLTQLSFTDVPAGTAAVQLRTGSEVSVRYSNFFDIEGNAVVTTGSVASLLVDDNNFAAIGGTAFGFGCADGSCVVSDAEVLQNLIEGAAAGLVFAPGSGGVVQDNTMAGMSGVGISVAGSGATTIERNFVEGSGDSLVVRGAAIVHSNIAVGQRSLVASAVPDLWIRGNTLVGPVSLDGWGVDPGQQFVNNAVVGSVPTPGGTAVVGGNVDCAETSACFYDADTWDFYPVPSSTLRTAGVEIGEPVLSDWCARGRQTPPTVGALEAPGVLSFGPIELIQKDEFFCILPDDPDDTDLPPTDTGDETPGGNGVKKGRTGGPGCGCDAGSLVPPWMLLLLVGLLTGWSRMPGDKEA